MRALMTLLTLGAAAAGYVYLNQTPVAGEPYHSKLDTPQLFDWHRDSLTKATTSRVPVKDLVNRIHEHTKSVLDDFAIQHGGHSDAPVDDAFQRLKQVAQSAVITSQKSNDSPTGVASNESNPSIVPLPIFDELQRTAFDPAAVDPSNDQAIHTVQEQNALTGENPQTTTATTQPKDDGKSPSATQMTVTADRSNKSERATEPVWRIDNAIKIDDATKEVSQQRSVDVPNRTAANSVSRQEVVATPVTWKVIGKTTQGLPMHSLHLGEGGTRTLIIAGLNGEDRTAVRWLELLAEEINHRPAVLKTNEFLFFRAGNPDGLVNNKRDNARGVPLNRNFPSRRYRPTMDLPRFAVPASEVETRVMLDNLYTFRPRRVIHLASTSGRSQVFYTRTAKNVATEFERSAKVTILPLDTEQIPGSLEDFADGTLEAAVLSMKLNVAGDWQKAWKTYQLDLIFAAAGKSIDESGNDTVQSFDPDRTPIPGLTVEPTSRRPRRRGYEELPPPPQ